MPLAMLTRHHGNVGFLCLLAVYFAASWFFWAPDLQIPGWSINYFRYGEFLPLYHNKIFSDSSKLQYAYSELPFVCPTRSSKHLTAGMAGDSSITLKLGEILRGDRITLSDYDLILGQNRQTQHICTVTVDERNVYWMQALIRQRYKIDWMVDNLPGASVSVSTDGLRKYYSAGFQLGFQEIDRETMESRYFIHNHVSLVVRLRLLPFRYGFESVITGFEAYPKSIQYGNWSMTSNATFEVKAPFELALTDNSSQTAGTAQLSIPYTYSIHYVQEDDDRIQWSNRWDLYRDEQEEPRLRVATVNAVIVFLITSFLSARLLRPTRRALVLNHVWRKAFGLQIPRSSPSKLDSVEAALKEDMTKWKLVHRDVFRVPQSGPLLAPLVGSGMQLVFVVSGMYFSGGIAFLESGHRDVFVSIAMALIVAGGAFSGYYSARLYKTFGGHLWRFNLLVTGILVPGLLFSTVFTINLFVWAQASSTAIPFGTLIALLVLLLGIQLPLVYLGGLYGHKIGPVWAHQFRPSSVPRPIPKQPWYLRKPQLILLAGIIPFQIILFEQAYAFNGLFHNRSVFHYAFGLSDLIHLMLFATIRHMAVTGTYLQLSFENHDWWWTSVQLGGSSALWLFAYTAWHWLFRSQITGIVASALYFCYSGLLCAMYWLLCGSLGFFFSYVFLRDAYAREMASTAD